MQRQTKKRLITFRNIKSYYAIFFVLFCVFLFVQECNRRSSLKNDPKGYLKAVVINEKAYNGNNPVSHSFCYKYAFNVNGVKYIGKSMNEDYHPGDSIEIEYVISDPSKNSPKDSYK